MTNTPRSTLRTRVTMALIAGTAAILTAAVLATTGSAQTIPTSPHLIAKSQPAVGFSSGGGPRQGDRFGFGDKITGDGTGIDRGVCTLIGHKTLLCAIQVQLSNGTLGAQGLVPEQSHNTPVAITGGTGAYNGARGTALITDATQTKTGITLNLLP